MSPSHHDVVIVGSRCAGSATAMLLARMGHDVALVDRSSFPSDTLSTHGISRAGVVQLNRWGLLDEVLATGAPPVRTVSFTRPEGARIERPVKHTAGVDLLIAPRRYILDQLLTDAAAAAGATLYSQTAATGVLRDDRGRITGVQARSAHGGDLQLNARCVIAADGRGSRLVPQIGAAVRHRSTSPSGTFYAYAKGLDATGFEFHLAPRALVGVFPTHHDEACVWIAAPAEELAALLHAGAGKLEVLRSMIKDAAPALANRLAGCEVGGVRGAVRLPNHLYRPAGPGWALVGDAGYHRDPITGHGISDAFRDAELLAQALDGWLTDRTSERAANLAYDEARTSSIQEIFAITRALTTFPGVAQFTELQKQLSQAIEHESGKLAQRPALVSGRDSVLAA